MEQYLLTPMLNYIEGQHQKNVKYSETDFLIKHVSCFVGSQQGNMPFGKFVFNVYGINLGVCDKIVHTK
jgi:hypothetical protein